MRRNVLAFGLLGEMDSIVSLLSPHKLAAQVVLLNTVSSGGESRCERPHVMHLHALSCKRPNQGRRPFLYEQTSSRTAIRSYDCITALPAAW